MAMLKAGKQCPKGHQLPRKSKTGLPCTVVFCADAASEARPKTKRVHQVGNRIKTQWRDETNADRVDRSKERVAEVKAEQKGLPAETRVELSSLTPNDVLPMDGKETPEEYALAESSLKASRRELIEGNASLQVRRRSVPVPAHLEGAEADEWVAKELGRTAPLAVVELKHQLLYSTSPGKRAEAARDLLDRAGHGKKDGNNGASGPVIVLNMGSATSLPWSQQGAAVQVVDAAQRPRDTEPPSTRRTTRALPFTVTSED